MDRERKGGIERSRKGWDLEGERNGGEGKEEGGRGRKGA